MTEPRPRRGSLYLVPVALGEHTPWPAFLPAQAQAIAAGLRHFVVETARAARAHLKQLDYPHPLRETDIRELPAEAADAVLDTLLAPALAGADLGLLSGYDRDEGKNCTYPPQTVVLQQKILAPAAPG